MLRHKNKQESCPDVFCKKGVLRNFAKFPGKQLCQRFFFNKVAGLGPLIKKSLWHKCFLVNFAKFPRTSFFTEHLRWLLLNKVGYQCLNLIDSGRCNTEEVVVLKSVSKRAEN